MRKNITEHQCHPEPVSGVQKLRRFRNKFGMTINNKSLAHLWERAAQVDIPPTKAKLAFTLAEVLITLGIIGIVASMTIPTLMQKYYEHQTVSKLRETYSIISQALKQLEDEYGGIESWGIKTYDEEAATILADRFKTVLKVATDCGTVDENEHCFARSYKFLNGNSFDGYAKNSMYYKITLLNGTSVIFKGGNSAGKRATFMVDTNGPSKPNTWGRDVFEIDYSERYGLVLDGNPSVGDVTAWNQDGACKDSGYGCAYYVVTFGNMDYLKKK